MEECASNPVGYAASLATLSKSLQHDIAARLPADQRLLLACVCRSLRDAVSESALWSVVDLSSTSGVARCTDKLLRIVAAKACGLIPSVDVLVARSVCRVCTATLDSSDALTAPTTPVPTWAVLSATSSLYAALRAAYEVAAEHGWVPRSILPHATLPPPATADDDPAAPAYTLPLAAIVAWPELLPAVGGGGGDFAWDRSLCRMASHPHGAPRVRFFNDEVVVLDDAYPRASLHVLIIARTPDLDSVAELRGDDPAHVALLASIRAAAEGVAVGARSAHSAVHGGVPALAGFQAVPSMRQLHPLCRSGGGSTWADGNGAHRSPRGGAS